MDEENISYLGDGAYVSHDGYHLVLMANSHLTPTDIVALEPEVFKRLIIFAKAIPIFRIAIIEALGK